MFDIFSMENIIINEASKVDLNKNVLSREDVNKVKLLPSRYGVEEIKVREYEMSIVYAMESFSMESVNTNNPKTLSSIIGNYFKPLTNKIKGKNGYLFIYSSENSNKSDLFKNGDITTGLKLYPVDYLSLHEFIKEFMFEGGRGLTELVVAKIVPNSDKEPDSNGNYSYKVSEDEVTDVVKYTLKRVKDAKNPILIYEVLDRDAKILLTKR